MDKSPPIPPTCRPNAKPFAAEHRIAIWQAAELAQALRGLPLG